MGTINAKTRSNYAPGTDMTEEEKQAMALKAQLAMGGGMPPVEAGNSNNGFVPTEEAIARGANNPPEMANLGAS